MVACLGLGIGAREAWALVCLVFNADEESWVAARAAQPFPPGTIPMEFPPGYFEQSPAGCLCEIYVSPGRMAEH
jgi:hypothetical protein